MKQPLIAAEFKLSGLLWSRLQQNRRREVRLNFQRGSKYYHSPPHPYFITANKGDLHLGPLSRSGLLSDTTCMEQPTIHMQI